MTRTAIVAAAVTAGIILTPGVAEANICDKHGTGTGHIYIHACATGNGGAGRLTPVWDERFNGIMRQSDVADWKQKREEEERASAEDSADTEN